MPKSCHLRIECSFVCSSGSLQNAGKKAFGRNSKRKLAFGYGFAVSLSLLKQTISPHVGQTVSRAKCLNAVGAHDQANSLKGRNSLFGVAFWGKLAPKRIPQRDGHLRGLIGSLCLSLFGIPIFPVSSFWESNPAFPLLESLPLPIFPSLGDPYISYLSLFSRRVIG